MDLTSESLQFADVQPGAKIADRYQVVSRIAAGGMGIVFKVIDLALDGEIVALKLLNPHLSQDKIAFKRFLNEVLVARSLSHPNIVRTHDIGKTQQGASYISMEYVDGETLATQLDKYYDEFQNEKRSHPGYAFEQALYVLLSVIKGVSYAHAQGIIHRDLKPANILFTKKNEVKVADFGTARIVGANTGLTQDGSIMGTPDYMSPEQISGEELDVRCDIYALGIIAYELVTGDKPFPGENLVQVAYQHVNEPIPSFEAALYDVPQWYQEMVRKAAAKRREDRFQSADAFAAAILIHAPELGGNSGAWQAVRSASIESDAPPTITSIKIPFVEPDEQKRKNQIAGTRKKSFNFLATAVMVSVAIGIFVGLSYGVFMQTTQVEHTTDAARAFIKTEFEADLLNPTDEVEESKDKLPVEKKEPPVSVTEPVVEPQPKPQVLPPPEKLEPTPPPVAPVYSAGPVGTGRSNGGALPNDAKVTQRNLNSRSTQRYQGSLGPIGGAQSTITLNITFVGNTIQGTAEISGRGSFRVIGSSSQRGLEMNLSGSTNIRLSGSTRDNALRGAYRIESSNESGTWQAVVR